jgi:hypothetical protein
MGMTAALAAAQAIELYIDIQTAIGREKQFTSCNTGWGYGPGSGGGWYGYGGLPKRRFSARNTPENFTAR